VRRQVEAFGFCAASLDIRQNSLVSRSMDRRQASNRCRHTADRASTLLSVEVRAEFFRAAQFVFRARFDLPHALARQVQAIADLLQRARLVVLEAEPEPNDLAFLAVEIAQ